MKRELRLTVVVPRKLLLCGQRTANRGTRDGARRIAANIAKLPELLRK